MEFKREYIGDGVYVTSDGYHLVLEVSHSNKIYLDDSTRSELLRILTEIAKRGLTDAMDRG